MERKYKRSRKRQNQKNSADQAFMKSLRKLSLSMMLCLFCAISSTWAWFVASAESHISVIEAQVPSTYIMSKKRISFHTNEDGEYELPAGTHTIAVDPLTGTAPMYALVHVRKESTSKELIKQALADFNENEEEKWLPLMASDSNSIMVLKSEEELEEFWDKNEENESRTYEILPISVVAEGTYRVDWEPQEDRIFQLTLKEDAYVSIEAFWLTEDSEEHPGLDEMMEFNYIIVYQAEKASPTNPKQATTAAKTEKEDSEIITESSEAEDESKDPTANESIEADSSSEEQDSDTTPEATLSKEETTSPVTKSELKESETAKNTDETNMEKTVTAAATNEASNKDVIQSAESTDEKEEIKTADSPSKTDGITPEMSTEDIEGTED